MKHEMYFVLNIYFHSSTDMCLCPVFVPPGPGAWAANGFTVIIIRRNQQKPEMARLAPTCPASMEIR